MEDKIYVLFTHIDKYTWEGRDKPKYNVTESDFWKIIELSSFKKTLHFNNDISLTFDDSESMTHQQWIADAELTSFKNGT